VLHRAAALASVMAGRRVIAVAGTHGKTTTTSMLTTILRDCGADPGYAIGGVLRETGLGAEDGAGMDFVAEADESDRSFLLLSPDAAVITNVEADHLDNYADLAEIEAAFITFGERVSGLVISCADDLGAEAVAGRMELKGEARGVRVLDSYAHHPTELAADLRAARDLADGGRVIAVFQPHLYSRTRMFAAGFGASLGLADEAIVLDVYAAREDPEPGVTGELVAAAVPGGKARFVPDMDRVPQVVAGLARPGDVVLTMGAGDVTKLGPRLVEALGG
jgi:UDP-N-acetylmuramate--alanine ligase